MIHMLILADLTYTNICKQRQNFSPNEPDHLQTLNCQYSRRELLLYAAISFKCQINLRWWMIQVGTGINSPVLYTESCLVKWNRPTTKTRIVFRIQTSVFFFPPRTAICGINSSKRRHTWNGISASAFAYLFWKYFGRYNNIMFMIAKWKVIIYSCAPTGGFKRNGISMHGIKCCVFKTIFFFNFISVILHRAMTSYRSRNNWSCVL